MSERTDAIFSLYLAWRERGLGDTPEAQVLADALDDVGWDGLADDVRAIARARTQLQEFVASVVAGHLDQDLARALAGGSPIPTRVFGLRFNHFSAAWGSFYYTLSLVRPSGEERHLTDFGSDTKDRARVAVSLGIPLARMIRPVSARTYARLLRAQVRS